MTEERRSKPRPEESVCAYHAQTEELMHDFYRYRDSQNERNVSCDLQLIQHEQKIDKAEKAHETCHSTVIPEIRGVMNKAIGGSALVGILFIILMFLVGKAINGSTTAQAMAEEAKDNAALIRQDTEYIKRDIDKMNQLLATYTRETKDQTNRQNRLMQQILEKIQ